MTCLDAPYLSVHTCKQIQKTCRANDNSFDQLITQRYRMASENFKKNNKYILKKILKYFLKNNLTCQLTVN